MTAVATQRAAIYVRVSSDKQEDNASLDTQEAACRAYAAAHGYHVVGVYRDVHTGMELHQRPRLGELRGAVRRRELAAVIAHDVDRLGRDQAHLYILDEEATRHGCELRFVLEEFDKSPIGKVVRGLKGFAAEVEREKIMERTARGRLGRAESGRLLPSSRPLYGYRWVDAPTRDGKGTTHVAYEPDPATAPVVQRIFSEYVAGGSLRGIAARLSAEGIPTATGGDRWAPTTVREMLTQVAYTGNATAWRTAQTKERGVRVRRQRPEAERVALPAGVVPPLVDAGTFAAARARLAENRAHGGRPLADPDTGLLRGGIGRCGYCGGAVHMHRAHQRDGSYRLVYRCPPPSRDRHGCPHFGIDVAKLDAEVWAGLVARLTAPQIVGAEAAALAADDDPGGEELAAIDGALAGVAKRQANVAAGMAALDTDEARAPLVATLKELAARASALRAERERVEARHDAFLHRRASLDGLGAACETLAERARDASFAMRKELLTIVEARVRVYLRAHEPRWEAEAWLPVYADGASEPLWVRESVRSSVAGV